MCDMIKQNYKGGMKMKNYYENFRKIIKDCEQGFSQKRIAEILDTTQSTVNDYESGKRPLPIEHLITLCKDYNISADYILGFPEKLPFPKKQ